MDDDGAGEENREVAHQMLRMLHLADARLGARHPDLGDAAAAHRERQFAALAAAVDVALAEKVDLVLISGDMFATGVVSRRTVERAAAEIGRLAASRVRTIILPGRHDPDDRASVYRAYDLAAMAGVADGDDLVSVLRTDRPVVHLQALDLVVAGVVADGGAGMPDIGSLAAAIAAVPAATWHVGLAHAAPGGAGGSLEAASIAATGLDYLALGDAPAQATGREGEVTWGVPGSPEQVVIERPEQGGVLLVTCELDGDRRRVTVEARTTGLATHREEVVDVATLESQEALVERLRASSSPDQLLDVRLAGSLPDDLVIDPAEVADALRADYLLVRVHDASQPTLTTGDLPPEDTVAGAFARGVEGRIADLEAAGDPEATGDPASDEEAAMLRQVLRLGRRLLAGEEVGA